MSREIHVHLLPEHCDTTQLKGGIAVVVDVLRASTTILTALQNGAAAVIPWLSVDDARAHRVEAPSVILGGERHGVILDGFDLSNSPSDYTRPVVENRTISFTTTNGTRALIRCGQASQVLIGAFSNATVLAEYLIGSPQSVHIVCAGTNGEVSGEDALFAGCLIDRILSHQRPTPDPNLTDTASMTLGWWRFESARRPLAKSLLKTHGGKNLIALSFEDDIRFAATIDSSQVLAKFEATTGLITLMNHDVV